MKRVKKGRSCYSIGGVVLDENQPIPQPALPQSQVSNFLASVRPDASTIIGPDVGLAASQGIQEVAGSGATAIRPPESVSQSAGLIGGPRYESSDRFANRSAISGGQLQGQQQIGQQGSNGIGSSLQAAAAEDANKRMKNILSGPYRYDAAGNKKYLGGNPYSASLVAAATSSPSRYGEQDRANRRRTTVSSVPYGYEEQSYSNGGIVEGASEALLRKMSEKYGVANPPPESMRPVEVKPQAAQQKKSEPPRRGFRTAERWREGGDYPIDVKYADGGRVIPVNIGQGLYQAIAQPIAEDWKQGNVAIKNVRDQYPIADTIAGIHPAVAAAQVANDVAAGNVGGDTAINVAQAVPVIKGLSGMAKMLTKQAGPTIGATKFVIDMPNTVRKNVALTTGQTLGQPANAFAAGGMVKFSGKGGPRDDQIPVKVAGQEINVSNGENAVILPAKTAANPAALYAIGGIIQATNDGRKPKMGMEKSDYYARGGIVGGNLSSSGSYVNEDDISGVENLKRAMATYAKPFQAVGQVFADSARAQQEGVSYQDILARDAAQNQDPVRARHNSILAGQGTSGTVDLPITERDKQAAIASTAAAKQGITAGIAQPSGAVVNDGMTTTQMGRGFDPTKLQMAPGYGMASNAAGKTIGGNMSPNQYVAADGTPGARWDETQQYKDAIARNERMKLELAAIQAGKKRGADPMAIQTAQQGIAGAMIGNQAKQEEMQRNDQSNALLKTAMNTKDPAQHRVALQNYLASRGVAMKDPDEWEIMAGGERSVPNGLGGFQVVKDPPIAFHKPTRQWIKADGSIGQSDGASQPKQAPQAAIEYLRANPGTAEQFKQRYGYLPQ